MKVSGIAVAALAAGWCAASALAAPPPKPAVKAPSISPEAAEFFEKNVRPVLAEQCYSCHGPKLQQAGLRLDSPAALLKGTDAGKPGIVVGDPEKSALIQAVRYTGNVKMPPNGKLPEKAIQALTEWVKMGAPWPGSSQQSAVGSQQEKKPHWAFQPVRKPALPAVKNKAWVKTPMDAFILQKLEASGLTPSKPADRRTLIRRASFDLIGLPPTAEEIEAFQNDKSPDAWEKVIDRLLASPHYGERWGRHWLDVARYSDTKGYVFQEERRYPFAYTYRDYVIRSLNEDLPYDQFIKQQIAADQLPLGDDKRPLAAMGFLTLGRRFLNNQADIIDDRMDVVFRGTQALTVGCARCHDHKFDPIPQKDYYSLYGVFASSTEPAELPLIAQPERTTAYVAFETELKKREAEVRKFLEQKHAEIMAQGKAKIAECLLTTREGKGRDLLAAAQKRDLSPGLVRRWQTFLTETGKPDHPVFGPWHLFADIPTAEWSAKAPAIAAQVSANKDLRFNKVIAEAFKTAPASIEEVAQRYQKVLTTPSGDQQIFHALDSIGGPLNFSVDETAQLLPRDARNQYQALKQKVDAFRATSPAAPPRAMSLVDLSNPITPHVFLRGNPNNPGPQVPRQFLAVLSGPDRKPFQKGSGRLELAEDIASKSNPLTARVMVNRVWGWHFGTTLVRTPSDFGTRSDPPTNPELLDYLASRFMDDGWSIKKLHKLIMLSSTYQQSSESNPRGEKINPENSLYWRMPRERLEWEPLRDSILAVAGDLDDTVYGPSVDVLKGATRRTVYAFIDRQNLPNVFRAFDLATPDSSAPARFQTTVPQQALYLINSPFIVEQAKKLAARQDVASVTDPTARIQKLYRIAYGRAASPDEVALGLKFINVAQSESSDSATAPEQIWHYGYGAFDSSSGRVKSFQPLTHFTGGAWQGGASLPDPKTGWAMLTAGGGHAGNDQEHAAIRRWTAPKDGTIAISGELSHRSEQGDGVRGRIVSSRDGVLGTYLAQHGNAATDLPRVRVKRGDTIDFVVDCRENVQFDSFNWAPVIKTLPPADLAQAPGAAVTWSAKDGFSGPARAVTLAPWEKYAQVLLISNEFVFVD